MKNLYILSTCSTDLFKCSDNPSDERSAYGSLVNSGIMCHCSSIAPYTIYVCMQLCDSFLLSLYDHQGKTHKQLPIVLPLESFEKTKCRIVGFNVRSISSKDQSAAVYLALNTGHLFAGTVSVNPTTNDIVSDFQPIATVDGGIDTLKWSPDGETAVLITCPFPKSFVLLTGDMQPLNESVILDPSLTPSHNPVDVGWGRPETQFSGQGENQKQRNSHDQSKASHLNPHIDSMESIVTWRLDGSKFSISVFDTDSSIRKTRIYQRDGQYLCSTENLPSEMKLGECFSWRHSGELLAAVSYGSSQDETKIIFFEPTGLRHGEFSVRESKSIIQNISWNIDSSILSIYHHREGRHIIQFWTMCNYHYYLKEEFAFDSPIISITWNPFRSGLFHFLTGSGLLHSIHVDWTITRASYSNSSETDPSIVGVIDGNKLLITPLLYRTVPPPMCSTMITIPIQTVIRDAFFFNNDMSSDIAILTPNSIFYYHHDNLKTMNTNASFVKEINFPEGFIAKQFFSNTHSSKIGVLGVKDGASNVLIIDHGSFQHICPSGIDYITATWYNHSDVILQDINGGLHIVNTAYSSHVEQFDIKCLPRPTHYIHLIRNGSECLIVSKSSNITGDSCLFVNDHMLHSGVSSFIVTSQFLIFTSTSKEQKVLFVPLPSLRDRDYTNVIDSASTMKRFLERGGIIVHHAEKNSSLILQMPRGNLEHVYPRCLVIQNIMKLLGDRQFYNAFMLCRQQRLDLNILVDAIELSSLSIDDFVEQVNQVEHLNLLLTQLKDEHSELLQFYGISPKPKLGRNDICRLVRDAIYRKGWGSSHVETLLTSFLVHVPPCYPMAIELLSSIDDKQKYIAAIKYTLFLVPGDRMYQEALSECHLTLALDIAQKCQKDPQDYLPFLQKLQQLPLYRQKYLANDSLKRYDVALKSLVESRDDIECIEYVCTRGLFKEAFETFEDTKILKLICFKYAEELLKGEDTRKFAKAANLYMLGSSSETEISELLHIVAICCKAGQVDNLQCIVAMLKDKNSISRRELDSIGLMIKDALVSSGEYGMASRALLEFCNDPDGAIEVLLMGKDTPSGNEMNLVSAIRTSSLQRRFDLVETLIKPEWKKRVASLRDELEKSAAAWKQLINRLTDVRKRNAEKPVHNEHDVLGEDDAMVEDETTASTAQSALSKQSFGSKASKSKRSKAPSQMSKSNTIKALERRRKAAEKSGSPYEEWYILDSIASIMLQFDTYKLSIDHICSSWVLLDGTSHMREVRSLLIKFNDMNQAISNAKNTLLQYPQVPNYSPSMLAMCGVGSIKDLMNDIYSAYFKVKFMLDGEEIVARKDKCMYMDWITLFV